MRLAHQSSPGSRDTDRRGRLPHVGPVVRRNGGALFISPAGTDSLAWKMGAAANESDETLARMFGASGKPEKGKSEHS